MLIGRNHTRSGQHMKCQITFRFGWNWKSTTQTNICAVFFELINKAFNPGDGFRAITTVSDDQVEII